MRLTGCERELLRRLASMPFLDRLELVAISGWSRGAVYEGVGKLEDTGLAASVPHATDLIPPTRRFHLTAAGVRTLVQEEGVNLGEALRARPLSVQWLRILAERIDALAVIYRLASTISNIAYPIRLRLYRAMPMDAAIALPGGRTVAVVRQGLTSDRTGFAKRIWRLRDGPLPGAVLLLLPDEVRLRHARRLLTSTSLPAFLALESDAALAGGDDPIWRPPSVNAALDLRYVLARMRPGGAPPAERRPSRASLTAYGAGRDIPGHMLPAPLKPAEKRVLDLLYDWPWISPNDLASLLAVSEPRASQLVTPLEAFGLVTRLSADNLSTRQVEPGVPAASRLSERQAGRLALTDQGLALLARRDRTSVGVARKRWSVAPLDPEGPASWRNVSGARSRQLVRNAEHTGAVHAFIAALARQCRALRWEMAQLDPSRRASRYFRHGEKLRSIHPDAFGVLRRGPVTWPFFLEWERRAVRPVTMAARLAPYLRYYSSHRPTDDHGAQPAVLVVFDDDLAATHFLRVAREEMDRTGIRVPLWVSHRAALDALGPPGTSLALARRLGARPSAGRPISGTGREWSSGSRPVLKGGLRNMSLDHIEESEDPRRRRRRTVVRLNTAALWERLALLGRSQNWLAGKAGISPGYLSMLVKEGRAPSGRIRLRMQEVLGVEDFHQLFTLEDGNDKEDQHEYP